MVAQLHVEFHSVLIESDLVPGAPPLQFYGEVRLLKKRMQRDPTTQKIAITAVDNFQDLELFECDASQSGSGAERRVRRMTSSLFPWFAPTGTGH